MLAVIIKAATASTSLSITIRGLRRASPFGGQKTWAPGKTLEQFFKANLGITPSDYKQMVERLCESAVEVGREVIKAGKDEPRWRDIAKQMVHAWNEGMASIRSVRREPALQGLSADIKVAGFSEPTPPKPPPRVGRSELLASPRSRRSSQSRRG